MVEIQRHDDAEQFRRDVETLSVPPTYTKAADQSLLDITQLFWGDVKLERLVKLESKCRVASALDRLAAAKGSSAEWSQDIADELRGAGLTFEVAPVGWTGLRLNKLFPRLVMPPV